MTTTTISSPVAAKYGSIFGPNGFLRDQNIERAEEVELLGLSLIGGVDMLFLGEPGVGKTWLLDLLVDHCIVNAELFSLLLAKDMSADEVLGPRDIMAMKAGQIARLTDGYLPSAHVGFLDEVFKSSPPLLNPLLDLVANRVLKVGGKTLDCRQLLVILMSSNELPDREDLTAFRDRIGITKMVQRVRTPEGMRAVTDIQLGYQAAGLDTSGLDPLTLDDIYAIKREVAQVTVGDPIRQTMVEAQQKLQEAGHPPSQRRIGQCWKIIKARAWSRGASEVTIDDFLPCQHMFWNHPDDAATAREIVLEFASVYTRKAARLREALEPVVAKLEELKIKFDGASPGEKNDLIDEGWKFLRQLKKLGKDASNQIKDGRATGQDTSMIEEVAAEIDGYETWAENTLTGIDEED